MKNRRPHASFQRQTFRRRGSNTSQTHDLGRKVHTDDLAIFTDHRINFQRDARVSSFPSVDMHDRSSLGGFGSRILCISYMRDHIVTGLRRIDELR